MLDDLDRPLGQDRKPPPDPGQSPFRIGALALGFVVAVAGGVYLFSARNDASSGEPEAVAVIQPAPPAPSPTPAPAAQVGAQVGAAQDGAAHDDASGASSQIAIESGVKVVRGNAGAPGALIIHVPDAGDSAPLPPAPDRRLVEKSRFGPLPRRSRNGATPAQVYARPLSLQPAFKPGTPRVAILVGGMGLDVAATESAIQRLPGAVSLAFAPYGAEVQHQAAEARAAGHEILLQTPMEPFNSADSPGPHVLRVGNGAKALDDLHWQMGRFTGYIGLVNFLGGRYTADQAATQLLMKDLAERGLDYVDDGSSPQSLAKDVAIANGVGFAKADLRLDASRDPASIDAALFRLETLARQNGVAIGFAAGLPDSIERIARFAADLKKRGVALIPVSAAIQAEALVSKEKR
ncbi:divergent polysaccharide deacetylase family protein [Rhodoblastus acidophilus]|uniref:Divergent polysaccharide deacetylase family protein n=1 Tax=Candidatus Rhodoblastus alkanivorans TaxID=2954117 RepID=A0ABS9Z3Z1_9HYPH|nr:divergent polysaccharide deacetylase family protein [Candidatus Rhodoblastus alkanivorans]MCI4679955.1 divergent polysaccharide deacetylase family protein [Candidatus Rhodoblastus alkanivorans]MCI4682338.1 divergent polysaccharide deacetylase family protein [Candidatus Rhodoblastus alkanivorans]MDI4639641.1 divergent polysaccharide deacetylase family protein [Rhodoblastus acidophilus]